ncbi:MAG: PAS domain S-box protein [Acidobacteriota bacterium]|nr:PAS domain S-box protein [Blastocatellia bacterium]MDW8240505.1 PAS domain S-box protein [Acidobacteriota bacterium]
MKDWRHQSSELESPSLRDESGYRILLIEDHPDHQLLEQRALQGLGAGTQVVVVTTAVEGLAALQQHEFDLVVADYQMPGMSGLEFLRRLNEQQIAVPVIIVTGLGNERVAVQALKQGAYDYVIKETGYLALLPSVAERAITATRTKRQLEEARRLLAESEECYRTVTETATDTIMMIDEESRITFVNRAAEKTFGYTQAEMLGQPLSLLIPAYQRLVDQADGKLRPDATDSAVGQQTVELIGLHKSGQHIPLEISFGHLTKQGKPIVTAIIRDITERKRAEAERQVIFEIIEGVATTANLDELLRLIHQSLKKLIYAENCFVALYDRQTEMFTFPFFVDKYDTVPSPQKVGRSCTAYVFRTGRPLLLTEESFRQLVEQGEVELVGTSSPIWLGVPLKTPTETIGVLVVQHYEDEHAYTERDLQLLWSVGGQIALAIERKRAEDALRQGAMRLETLVGSIDEIVMEFDQEGRYLNIWTTNDQLLVRPKEELLGRYSSEVLGEEFVRPFLEIYRRVLLTGHAESVEYPLEVMGGKRWFLARISPIPSADGSYKTVCVLARDITERKQMEQALEQRNQQLNILYEQARREAQHSASLVEVTSAINSTMQIDELLDLIVEKVLVLTNSKQGSLFLLNESGELTPCAPRRLVEEQARGLRFKVGEGIVGWVAQTGQGVLLNDVRRHPKFKLTAPFWPLYSMIAVPLLIQESVAGVLCIDRLEGEESFTQDEFRIVQDFAKQAGLALAKARLFEALRRSQQQYQTLVEASSDIIFSLDLDGRITYINPAIQHTGGYAPEEVIGKPFLDFIHPDDRATVTQLFAQRLQGDIQMAEFRAIAKNGEVRLLQSSGRALIEGSRIVSLTGVIRDVTEQKQAEEENRRLQQQLLHAQKMESIGTLAGGIAHDFNNLLQGILGYTSLVLQQVEPGSESHRYLRTILDSAERAANLTRQMLTFSRRREPKIEPIAINRLVEESIWMLRHMIPTTIDIQTRLAPDLWTVEADATQIQQVLMNLCVNARDAMPGGGILRLETANHVISQPQSQYQGSITPGRYVLITVSDTGIGMTPEVRERIFEPFFTTKGVGEGTGLGLAVVYGIVCSHNGWINVQSQPGHGAVFQIYLPASEKEVVSQQSVTESITTGQGTILVVDDEPVVLKLACDILTHYGYNTLTANDGEEAIRVFEERMAEIDLVLVDLTMPKLNGLECARRLRALNPTIPVIASSGYSAHTAAKLNGEVNAFVPKPYYPKDLAATVSAILRNNT